MKIDELEGVPGDTATYTKDNGRDGCELLCISPDVWLIQMMIGKWTLSEDGEKLIGGELIYTTAKQKAKEAL